MPLVYQQNINDSTRLGIWHIDEDEDYFQKIAPLQKGISHPHKRLQHLAGRILLRELFPDFPLDLILIADTRKPFLKDEAYHFSISHCADYAAAIVSTKSRVGVDIEVPQQKISSIRNKYLSEGEQIILQNLNIDPLMSLTLGWSIKEAVFKWYAAGRVDFRAHMQIVGITRNEEFYFVKCFFSKDMNTELQVIAFFTNGNCLAYVIS